MQGECLSAAGGPDRPLPPEAVFEKMSALAEPAYPGIRLLFETLAALPAKRMAQGWATIVSEFCNEGETE